VPVWLWAHVVIDALDIKTVDDLTQGEQLTKLLLLLAVPTVAVLGVVALSLYGGATVVLDDVATGRRPRAVRSLLRGLASAPRLFESRPPRRTCALVRAAHGRRCGPVAAGRRGALAHRRVAHGTRRARDSDRGFRAAAGRGHCGAVVCRGRWGVRGALRADAPARPCEHGRVVRAGRRARAHGVRRAAGGRVGGGRDDRGQRSRRRLRRSPG